MVVEAMDLEDIQRLLDAEDLNSKIPNILQWTNKADLLSYTSFLELIICNETLLLEKEDTSGALRTLLQQELSTNLRKPTRLGIFARLICQNDHFRNNFVISKFAAFYKLEDHQHALLAAELVYNFDKSGQSTDSVLPALVDRFQLLSRHIGFGSREEETTPEEMAHIARRLLLNTHYLSTVQKFVVEYAIFQRYQNTLPPDIADFFEDYNTSRAADDQSKSLAQLFDETRGHATNTITSVEQIFKRTGLTRDEVNVEKPIGHLIMTLLSSGMPAGTWNGEKLARGIYSLFPRLKWSSIIFGLDSDDFEVSSPREFALLMSIIKGAISAGATDVPIQFFWGTWRNTRSQASLLHQLTQAPLSVFNITDIGGQTVLSADDFVSAAPSLKNLVAQLETSPWNSLELLQTSLRLLSDTAAASETKHFLEAAGKSTPELIFLGCIQLPQPWGAQQDQLCEKGCEVFFGGQPNHQLVFYRLWQVDPEFLCQKFIEYHKKDSLNISRILDIAQDLRVLDQLLNLQPYSFAIDLAALASRREYLNIEKWLDHHISTGEDVFIDACLRYLSGKAEAENILQQSEGPEMPLSTVALRVETVAVFLKALMNTAMSPENGEFLKQVQSSCLQVYPRLLNSTNANRDPLDSNNFAKDVEKEVEFYYGRLYEGDMSIASFVEMLHSLKRSDDVRDQDVFACMLHSLFDEYRFFADYPVSALNITAVLFGSLIQNQLLAYIPLGIALRYILDAVGHEPHSSMFKFGVQALDHFQNRVPAWPQYCQQILAVPTLNEYEPGLVAAIRNNEQQSMKSRKFYQEDESTVATLTTNQASSRPVFRSLAAGSSLREPSYYIDPSVEISDKILFNINNMSLTNLSEKLAEVKSVLIERYHAWFANHLVSQRAAIEPNYHSLYIHFLEAMQSEDLIYRVLQETIVNISLLLNADSTITSTVERGNLKNLGSWLGGLTLARNLPLKHKMISLKDLLLEGFDDNRLIVVLPFVCRVLEQSVSSKVFKPPCPWTMAILGLLVELYESADMKLNLKFEVEVLCKKLDLQMSDVPASAILSNRPLLPSEPHYITDDLEALNIRDDSMRREGVENLSLDQSTAFVASAVAEMPMVIHPIIQQNFAVPNLRRLLFAAAEQAIREFILPVVERSVAVSSISTLQLVSKDFALEEDVNKFRRAAHTMNQNLAGSLALVTCKEPLRGAFTANLRILLAQSGFEGLSQEGETLLAQLISDNLDDACSIVEKAACERAISEIDEGLAPGYQARRKHLESRSLGKFSDSSAPRLAFPLPDSLRIKSSGLTNEQMSTYDDFARVPRTAQEAVVYYTKEEVRPGLAEQESSLYRSDQLSLNTFEQILHSVVEVDSEAREQEVNSIEELPAESTLRKSLQQIPLYLAGLTGSLRDERALTCSQRVCQLLFRTPYNELAARCLTLLLNLFVELSLKTFRDVSIWLVHSEDSRKYNVPVIYSLIRAQIIVPSEFDVQLAKQINEKKVPANDFAIGLISECILGPLPVALRTDFTASLDALETLVQNEALTSASELFSLLHSQSDYLFPDEQLSIEDSVVREQLSLMFMEWVHLISHPASSEKVQLAYILQMQRVGITTRDDMCSLFFRSIVEQSVESALRMMPASLGSSTAHYLVIDAVAKLVVLMLKFDTKSDVVRTAGNLRRFLHIVVMVLSHDQDTAGDEFNQRPYFRLLSSLLSELHSHSNGFSSDTDTPLLMVFCELLQTLQPLNFPGFAFSWVTLMSHRLFLPKLLVADAEQTWPAYSHLLVNYLQFLAPGLQASELTSSTRVLYHAMLRILLVLLNDFPGLLDEFHHDFMIVIPDGCVQLRNLILSAFPRNLPLPDPFLPGLKVDRLPETAHAPRIRADLEAILISGKVLSHVHNYIYSMNTAMIPKIVRSLVKSSDQSADLPPDTTLLSTLVLHCGVQAMNTSTSPPIFEVNSPWVSLLHELFKIFGPAGRYKMLGAIANQLRYPNSHTYFFSCVLLLLFSNGGDQEALVKEQITRVLLERLICNRPHPWGILITFTELLRNSKYGFWDLKFIRTTQEVEVLFQSLFQHINQGVVDDTPEPTM